MKRFVLALSLAALAGRLHADPPIEERVDLLIEALHHTDPLLQASAVEALGSLGVKAEKAIPALISRLKELKPPERGFGGGGPRVFDRQLVTALSDIGPPAIPALLDLLKNTPDITASFAVQSLEGMKEIPADHARALIELATNKDLSNTVRGGAARVLGKVRPVQAQQLPTLRTLLVGENQILGRSAVAGIGATRLDGALAAPDLIARLKLIKLAAPVKPTLPMGQSDDSERMEIVQLLGNLGPSAKDAIPLLLDLLKDSKPPDSGSIRPRLQPMLMVAMARIAPGYESAVSALSDSLKSESRFIRIPAEFALAEMGDGAKSVLPLLEKDLKIRKVIQGTPDFSQGEVNLLTYAVAKIKGDKLPDLDRSIFENYGMPAAWRPVPMNK